MVEFALLAPVFFMMLMAILDFGRVGFYYVATSDLARFGARTGAVFRNGTGWGSSTTYSLTDQQSEAQGIKMSVPAGCPSDIPVPGSLTSCEKPADGHAYFFYKDVPASGTTPHYVEVSVVYAFTPTTPMISAITGTIYVVANSSMDTEYV
jgi:hypothetical protein